MSKRRHHLHLQPRRFLLHLAWRTALAGALVLFSLAIGTLGYHSFADLDWVDAILNAAMILTGMGPVNELHQTSAKLFAASYALFSGIVFLTTVAILFAPILHRFLHHFHLDLEESNSE